MSRRDEGALSVPVTKEDHIEGGDAAAITLIEYGDYQCPFCG
jgi:protein-disulfide isomerase